MNYTVRKNMTMHDPESPLLIGHLQPEDQVHEARQESWIDHQIMLDIEKYEAMGKQYSCRMQSGMFSASHLFTSTKASCYVQQHLNDVEDNPIIFS